MGHTIAGRQDNRATRMEKMLKRLMGERVEPASNAGSVEMVLEQEKAKLVCNNCSWH